MKRWRRNLGLWSERKFRVKSKSLCELNLPKIMSLSSDIESGGEARMAAFFAEFEHVVDVIPDDSKELFSPLVFGVARILLSGTAGHDGSFLTPFVDPMVKRIFPNYRTEADLPKLFLDYLMSKGHREILQELYDLGSNTYPIAGARLREMFRVDPNNKKDAAFKSWEYGLARYGYSAEQIQTIAQLEDLGTVYFLSSVQILAVYVVIQERHPMAFQNQTTVSSSAENHVSTRVLVPPVAVLTPAAPTVVPVSAGSSELKEMMDMLRMVNTRFSGLEQTVRDLQRADRVQFDKGTSQQATKRTSQRSTTLDLVSDDIPDNDSDDEEDDAFFNSGVKSLMVDSDKATAQGRKGELSMSGSVSKPSAASFTAHSGKSVQANGTLSAASSEPAPAVGGWWGEGTALMDDVTAMRNNYGGVKHRSMQLIKADIYGQGLHTIDYAGLPHRFHIAPVKKHECADPVIESVLYNPDNDANLNRMKGDQNISRFIVPASPLHFVAFIQSCRRKVLKQTSIKFAQDSVAAAAQCIEDYNDKFMTLLESKLGYVSDIQVHPRHITTWALLVCLHINFWMTAILAADLSLLVKDFDAIVEAQYNPLLHVGPSGLSKIDLKLSMELLNLICPICCRKASCSVLCMGPNCKVDTLATPSVKKVHPEGSKPALAAFKKKHPEWKDNFSKMEKAFYAEFPEFYPSKSTAVPSAGGYEALAQRQELIKMHPFQGRIY